MKVQLAIKNKSSESKVVVIKYDTSRNPMRNTSEVNAVNIEIIDELDTNEATMIKPGGYIITDIC